MCLVAVDPYFAMVIHFQYTNDENVFKSMPIFSFYVNILLFYLFLRLHTKEISLISARYCTVLIMMDKTVTLISGETGFLVEIKR